MDEIKADRLAMQSKRPKTPPEKQPGPSAAASSIPPSPIPLDSGRSLAMIRVRAAQGEHKRQFARTAPLSDLFQWVSEVCAMSLTEFNLISVCVALKLIMHDVR